MSDYCRECKDRGIMFLGSGKVFALCERINGMYTLVNPCDVKYSDILTFVTKKEAIAYAKKVNYPRNMIIRFGNRFGKCWAFSWGNCLNDVWIHTRGNFSI